MASALVKLPTDGITHEIIGGAIQVHRDLGPGLLERTYEVCLDAQLRRRGLHVQRQVAVPIRYLDVDIACAYRMDMLVEGQVAVELKVADRLVPVFTAQLLSYLRLSDLRVGLLFNFNVEALVDGGWKRVVRDRE